MKYKISKYCKIRNGSVEVDGKTILKTCETPGTSKQFKEIYLSTGIDYPKFYKMDMLSKLAFLAVELLKSDRFCEKNTAVIFANRHSTTDVDLKYINSIDPEKYFPNPSLFVYTLPNVMIGEISIRHNLKGETIFISLDCFDGKTFEQCLNAMICDNCIIGFIEYESESNFEAFTAFLEKTVDSCDKAGVELEKIYNS